MNLYDVWVAKFERNNDFYEGRYLFIDDKSDYRILAVKDEARKCVIDIETKQEYRYFDRDDKNRILPHEHGTIKPDVYYALRLEEPDLSKKSTLERLLSC